VVPQNNIKNINISIDIFNLLAIILNMQRQIVECPVCDVTLQVSELSCPSCRTKIQGQFPTPSLARLSVTHQEFICTFIQCRGVIRDVEEVLGISYPTVRTRLDAAVEALQALQSLQTSPSVPSPAGAGEPIMLSKIAPGPTKEELNKEELSEVRQRELLRLVESGDLDPALAAEALRNRNLL
jgi:hypothetical protein